MTTIDLQILKAEAKHILDTTIPKTAYESRQLNELNFILNHVLITPVNPASVKPDRKDKN